MYHRYGRHGPRAWLRWHKRRYPRPSFLPALANKAEVTVIETGVLYVRLPINVERIIFILMSNDDKEKTGQELQTTGNQSVSSFSPDASPNRDGAKKLLPSSESTTPTLDAQWQAFRDAKEIKQLSRSGKFVRIDLSRVEDRIERLVDHHLQEHGLNGGPPPSISEYQEVVDTCKKAYWTEFHKYIGGSQEEIGNDQQEEIPYLHSPIEARLRDLAILDRKESSPPWRRPSHQRDLAVIRVLVELDLSLDTAQHHLEEIHNYADLYEKYSSNPREEVIWPSNQESF